MESVDRRLDQTEGKNLRIQRQLIEITNLEEQNKKRMKKNEENL